MFKRMSIVTGVALLLLVALSACSGNPMGEALTPIPTLPPSSQEPTLVASIQQGAEAAAQGQQGGGETDQAQLVAQGQELFQGRCAGCHTPEGGVGPAFNGMAERAATRVEGLSAEEYIHESIVNPSEFIVPGYENQMPQFTDLSDQQVNALVAYIMAESGGGQAAPAETPQASETPAAAAPTETAAPAQTPRATEAAAAGDTPAPETVGDPQAGQALFQDDCSSCHQEGEGGVGPPLNGMGERAATRIAGMSAVDYLHESIVDPSAFVVDGYPNIMPTTFGQNLSDQQINDLIAYILTQ